MIYVLQDNKPAPFGWDAFNQQALANAYNKRAEKIPVDPQRYEQGKAQQPELYDTSDTLEYGIAPKVLLNEPLCASKCKLHHGVVLPHMWMSTCTSQTYVAFWYL